MCLWKLTVEIEVEVIDRASDVLTELADVGSFVIIEPNAGFLHVTGQTTG